MARTRLSRKNITTKEARAILKDKVKSPARDKGRAAKKIAPAVARTKAEFRLQRSWARTPNRLDLEGIDHPAGFEPTPIPERRKPVPKEVAEPKKTELGFRERLRAELDETASVEAAADMGSAPKVGFTWEAPTRNAMRPGETVTRTIKEIRGDKALIQSSEQTFPEITRLDDVAQEIERDGRSLAIQRTRDAKVANEKAITDEKHEAKFGKLESFLSTLTPMQAGRADKALKASLRLNGQHGDRFGHIERLVGEGWTIQEQRGERRFVGPNGTSFLTDKDLTKTGLDYAESLGRTPSAEPEDPTGAEALFQRPSERASKEVAVETLLPPRSVSPSEIARQETKPAPSAVDQAEKIGAEAFASGDTNVPAQNMKLMQHLSAEALGKPAEQISVLIPAIINAFTKGHAQASLAVASKDILIPGELASVMAKAEREIRENGVSTAKGINVKIVGNAQDKYEIEKIGTDRFRRTMPTVYDTLEEARTGAIKTLTSELIEKESIDVTEEFEGEGEGLASDNALQSAERSRIDDASLEVLSGVQAEVVPSDEKRRRTRQDSSGESRSDQGLRSQLDPDRSIREPSVVVGDQGDDFGAAGGLIAKKLAEPAVPIGQDYILDVNELAKTDSSPTLRFDANLAAIRVLKRLEETNAKASSEQQEILARYSGFGDSAFENAFTLRRDDTWRARGEQLKELLTTEEYNSIEQSRLNAFYTTPSIAQCMWQGLEHLGSDNLAHPRILEPSAGSGRFLGLQPTDMAARSKRTAVELDTVTGGILSQLYQNANTHVTGFESAPIANDSQDLAIGNVPFGNFPVFDRTFKGRKHLTSRIHNYFFAKTLDKLRPGGVMAFITSHGTLDAGTEASKQVRESLAEQGDFIGAIRLPRGAFPDTEVVTDMIFMRKRLPGDEPGDNSWVNTDEVTFDKEFTDWRQTPFTKSFTFNVNQYFIDHPDMILGKQSAEGKMRRENEYTVEMNPDRDLVADIKTAIQKLPGDIIVDAPIVSEDDTRRARKPSPINVRENSYVLDESGDLLVKRGGELAESGLTSGETSTVLAMLGVRDAGRAVLQAQVKDEPDAVIKEAQKRLNSVYDAFVLKHGALNSKDNIKLMGKDPDAPLLRAMERADEGANRWRKMPLFSQRVIKGLGEHQAGTPLDAMRIVQNESAFLDFDRMAAIMGDTPENVRDALAKERAIYKNPAGDWETSDQYLSGDVREKLALAERFAKKDPLFNANVEALQSVIPEDLEPSEIYAQLGVPWVPDTDINEFTKSLLGVYSYRQRDAPIFSYNETIGEWFQDIAGGKVDTNRSRNTTEYGTSRMPALEIIRRLLQGKSIVVNDSVDAGDGKTKSVRNEKESVAAQEKANLIQEKFTDWLWADPNRAERLSRYYNDHFNSVVPREFDGSHQTFPGMSLKWSDQLHTHQRDAVWRTVEDGTALLAHEVGFGKTAVMVGAGMEMRRLGLSRKNVYVVPKATHSQFQGQFKEIYPYAKILAPTDKDFSSANRSEFVSRIATGDWDAVILSMEQFQKLPLSPETQVKFLNQSLNDLRAAAAATESASGESKAHKDIQKQIKTATAKILDLQASIGDKADNTLYFEDIGIDQLFVDEADNYKNLGFATSMGQIKGLPNSSSQRSFDMFQKVRLLQERGNGRGVIFATGTPVANSVAELWTMMRYLQPDMLEDNGLQHFDAWAKTFGGTTEALEQTAQGTYRLTQRFAKFNNIPELSALWQQAADIRVTSEVPAITKLQPKLLNEKGENARDTVAAPRSDALAAYMDDLAFRAGNLPNVDPSDDNMLKISSDARKASLDMRLVDPSQPDDPNSKASEAVKRIARIYKETEADKGTQLLFLDIGTPKAKKELAEKANVDENEELQDGETEEEKKVLDSVYQDLRRKMVAQGIPNDEIEFIHNAKTDIQRDDLFKAVNKGKIRVVIGSTAKMGVGVNVQERIAALHHLDAPWRPRDIEQREGRAIRQGNKIYGPTLNDDGEVMDAGKGINIYNYVTEGSFDAYMWQAIEAKAKAIKSLLRRKVTARTIEDADDFVLSASEAKALASGNPDVMLAVKLKNDVQRLQLVKSSHQDQQLHISKSVGMLPLKISAGEAQLNQLNVDSLFADKNEDWDLTIGKTKYSEKEKDGANEALRAVLMQIPPSNTTVVIGKVNGFTIQASNQVDGFRLILKGESGLEHVTSPFTILGEEDSKVDIVQRSLNQIKRIPGKITERQRELERNREDLAAFARQANKPFERDEELQQKRAELALVEKRLSGIKDEPDEDFVPSRELVGAF